MKNKIIVFICMIVSVAGIVFLYAGVNNYKSKQRDISAVYVEFGKKLSALEADKRAAEQDILLLDDSVKDIDAKSTVSLIMCGMSEQIYTTAYPDMVDYGFTGTIVITADRLPGGDGLLNNEQILELVNAGWKLIPGWSAEDGETGIASAAQWISDCGYSFEGVVYIDQENYTEAIGAAFAEAGYNTVIIDLPSGGYDAIFTDTVGEVWMPFSMGYQTNSAKTILKESMKLNGNLIYTVGFEEENELYSEDSLPSMLQFLKSCEESGDLLISDIASVRSARIEKDAEIQSVINGITSEKEAKKALIEEINGKIEALYKEFEKK